VQDKDGEIREASTSKVPVPKVIGQSSHSLSENVQELDLVSFDDVMDVVDCVVDQLELSKCSHCSF